MGSVERTTWSNLANPTVWEKVGDTYRVAPAHKQIQLSRNQAHRLRQQGWVVQHPPIEGNRKQRRAIQRKAGFKGKANDGSVEL